MMTSLTAARGKKSNEIANVKGLAGGTHRRQGTVSGEMDHRLRAHSVPPKELSLDPRIYVWGLTTACPSSSRGPDVPGLLGPFTHMHIHTHI